MIDTLRTQLMQQFPLIVDIRKSAARSKPPLPPSQESTPPCDADAANAKTPDAVGSDASAADATNAKSPDAVGADSEDASAANAKTPDAVGSDATNAKPSDAASLDAVGSDATNAKPPDVVAWDVVVRQYDVKAVGRILEQIMRFAQEHHLKIEPVIMTQAEANVLVGLGEDAQEIPSRLFLRIAKEENDPLRAHRHIWIGLGELQRVLQAMELEFPTSGLHAWSVGMRFQMLFEQLLRWSFAFHGQSFASSNEANEAFFATHLCGEGKLFAAEFAMYPALIRAFLRRHELLAALVLQDYGDNDLEIERLITPLARAIKAARGRVAREIKTFPKKPINLRRLAWSMIAALLCLATIGGIYYWLTRPRYLPALRPFAQASRAGGIQGAYYEGTDFHRFLVRRVDDQINYYWQGAPHPKVPPDRFSIRWDGFVEAPSTGRYEICMRFDDGIRLMLADRLLLNYWRRGWSVTQCAPVHLQKGWHRLQVEMFELHLVAEVRLLWKLPHHKTTATPEPIPAKHLCCR